jgi:hypothetical protein
MLTFANHISDIGDKFSPDLLAPAYLKELKELCGLFPFDISADFGFESRLGDPAPFCDFFLEIREKSEGAAVLAGKSRISSLSPSLLEDPAWQKISALFSEWTNPGSFLEEKVFLFWLEFDFVGPGYNPVPNLFFQIRNAKGMTGPDQWSSMKRVLDEMYLILFGIRFPDDLGHTMNRSILELPKEAFVFQFGLMLPRKTEAVRLIIAGLDTKHLSSYLDRLNWSGEKGVIENLIAKYQHRFDYAVVNLHLGNEILPDLGLELYLKNLKQPNWEPRWKENFHFLESESLLLESKRIGLIGYCVKKTVAHLYKVNYVNGINHLKLVYKKGMPLGLKGYFGTYIR